MSHIKGFLPILKLFMSHINGIFMGLSLIKGFSAPYEGLFPHMKGVYAPY